jgi:hypothetical protein
MRQHHACPFVFPRAVAAGRTAGATPMIDIARTQAGNYATAVMLVAVATVLQALAIRFGGVNLPLVLYYPMLAGAAWATSFVFGIVSTAASGLLVWTLFLSDAARGLGRSRSGWCGSAPSC